MLRRTTKQTAVDYDEAGGGNRVGEAEGGGSEGVKHSAVMQSRKWRER